MRFFTGPSAPLLDLAEAADAATDAAAGRRRWSLWGLLVVLVLSLLAVLVWLAGRHESSLVQARLEQSAQDAVLDIRSSLARNLQGLQALHTSEAGKDQPDLLDAWQSAAQNLLRARREMLRLEWRSTELATLAAQDTGYRSPVFALLTRADVTSDIALTCNTARRLSGPAYSRSYFLPQAGGLGLEVLDLCLPLTVAGRSTGYLMATYSLEALLGELISPPLARGTGVSFTEADGTRLALLNLPSGGSRAYVAQQLLDLPGNTLVLRLETRLGTPALFPNVLSALVTTLSLALLAVVFLLARDMRRRQRVEHDLGEALAFRKAMEDSLSTGLRARDLQGRITYVNPAFCAMVGVEAHELLKQSDPSPSPSPPASPYWPPELASIYRARQEVRLAGQHPPRGGHESIFMRRDGTRFPVLIMEAPLINAAGKHTGWMSAILDVSEQRRVEEQSRASADRLQATARLAMVGEMASLLSHELNQPLAAISSYAAGSLNLLQDGLGTPAPCSVAGDEAPASGLAPPVAQDLQLALRRIAGQAERAGTIIKSVHDFVRRRKQVREAVAPGQLLEAIMPLLSLQARKLGVRLAIEVHPGCASVQCDRTMVEQVLLNLCRNGMQSMQAEPDSRAAPVAPALVADKVLTLQVRSDTAAGDAPRRVRFSVRDAGEGIADEVAAQLFTPFFTTRAEGMGLGLSLCRTVIEQHGGTLRFEPGVPHGTVFWFTLAAA
jgi:two-component system, LuxR family, sensor histidine kinase DctS